MFTIFIQELTYELIKFTLTGIQYVKLTNFIEHF